MSASPAAATPAVDDDRADLRPGARLLAEVEQRLAADGDKGIDVVPANCLSNCPRGCSAAVSASGKWTYVIGDLDPDRHAGDIIDFARQHRAHASRACRSGATAPSMSASTPSHACRR